MTPENRKAAIEAVAQVLVKPPTHYHPDVEMEAARIQAAALLDRIAPMLAAAEVIAEREAAAMRGIWKGASYGLA